MQLGPKSIATAGQNRPYSQPEPQTTNQTPAASNGSGEEIPIIEEDRTPPPAAATTESDITNQEAKQVSFEGDAADEIDVKDIPF
jgi:hypothetical protein